MQVFYLWHVRCTWAGPCTDATRRRQITTRHCPSRPQVPIATSGPELEPTEHSYRSEPPAHSADWKRGCRAPYASQERSSVSQAATKTVAPRPQLLWFHPPARPTQCHPALRFSLLVFPRNPALVTLLEEPKCLWLEFAVVYHLITILIYRRSLLCACEQRKTSSCARCDHCIQAAHMPSEGVVCHAYAILVRYVSAAPRRS